MLGAWCLLHLPGLSDTAEKASCGDPLLTVGLVVVGLPGGYENSPEDRYGGEEEEEDWERHWEYSCCGEVVGGML